MAAVREKNNVKYAAYDFRHECKGDELQRTNCVLHTLTEKAGCVGKQGMPLLYPVKRGENPMPVYVNKTFLSNQEALYASFGSNPGQNFSLIGWVPEQQYIGFRQCLDNDIVQDQNLSHHLSVSLRKYTYEPALILGGFVVALSGVILSPYVILGGLVAMGVGIWGEHQVDDAPIERN